VVRPVPRHAQRRQAQRRTRWLAAAVAVVLVVAAFVAFHLAGAANQPARTTARVDPPASAVPAHAPASAATTDPPAPVWQVAWGSAMAWAYQSVDHATVRSLARVAVGGDAMEVRISNEFGGYPLVVGDAMVAPSTGAAAVAAPAAVALTFDGARQVTIPAGASVTSDPAKLVTTSAETVAVSVYVTGFDYLSSHYPCCEAATPSYVSAPNSGDLTAAPAGYFGYQADWSRLVDAVSVQRPASSPGSVVVLGDSISDGFNSTVRWPHLLQERIDSLPPAARPAVINEGNTANTLTDVTPSDALTGGGPPGLDRLDDDALSLPGVHTLVLLLGTNDLYFGASADAVIAGMQTVVADAHAKGIRVVALTLLPRQNGREKWSAAQQAELEQVDTWMLDSDSFDAVVATGPIVGDIYNGQCNPTILFPPYNSGDGLHLSPAGATALADAFPVKVLGLPPLPAVPPLVAVTPTRGCH
jgi:lysophospholipase L1-like esterase